MKSLWAVRGLFAIAALYDGVLGLAFLVAGPAIFEHFGITQPNHWGYVHFPAGLLLVFALMFLATAIGPRENRNLIPYGILLKFCFVATVFWHWTRAGISGMWKPFAFCDLAFLCAFVWAYRRIGKSIVG